MKKHKGGWRTLMGLAAVIRAITDAVALYLDYQ